MAQERLRLAAEKAGFKHIAFQLEPIAAALNFEASLTDEQERLVLVGDFGGGTSDFTVMKLRRGSGGTNRRSDVLSIGGAYVGGDTFDSLLMWEKVAYHFGRGIRYQDSEAKLQEFPPAILTKLKQWHLISQLQERDTREVIRRIKAKANNPSVITRLEQLIEKRETKSKIFLRPIRPRRMKGNHVHHITAYIWLRFASGEPPPISLARHQIYANVVCHSEKPPRCGGVIFWGD